MDPSPPASFGRRYTVATAAGVLLLLVLGARSAIGQQSVPENALDRRWEAFEARYRLSLERGEGDDPAIRDRYRQRREAYESAVEERIVGLSAAPTDAREVLLSDREALVALYNATGGDGWFSRANWLSSAPIQEWSDVVVENGRVVELTLFNNNLVGPLPQEIGDLTALRKLELDGNRLSGTLPSAFGQLVALTTLFLDDNELSGALPAELAGLEALTRLLADDNRLIDLPDFEDAPSGLLLAVRRNRLTFEDIVPSLDRFDFRYAPQQKVGQVETRNVASGSAVTLSLVVGGGAQNRYQWMKNGVPIPGATGDTYVIASATAGDAGVYVLEVRNDRATRPENVYTDLVLRSEPISVVVDGSGPSANPVAADDRVSTPRDTPVIIDVLANDVDPQGDALQLTAITEPPANGTATANGNGTISYAPYEGFEGVDSFSYAVADPQQNEATARVYVTVGAAVENQPPVAVNDTTSTPAGTAVVIDVLANDTDADGDALRVEAITTSPSNGTAGINAEGRVTYTPEAGFTGVDGFTYRVGDGRGGSAEATVVVSITPTTGNRAPLAVDDTAETDPGVAVEIDVLANDSDPDGDTIQLVGIAAPPSNGTATPLASGRVEYRSDPGFSGADRFEYEISDGNLVATATVSIVVRGVANPAPLALADAAETQRDQAIDIAVLANDSDPNGDALTVAAVGLPSHGAAEVNADGSVRYTPATGFVGADRFDYQISDGTSAASAAVSVTVTARPPQNRPPVAAADVAATTEGAAVEIDVLANDADLDGDPLTVVAATLPAAGSAVVVGGATVVYTPAAGFSGSDGFSYQITDGKSGAVGQVTVTVASADGGGTDRMNLPPTAVADVASTVPGAPLLVDVLANDVDPEQDALTLTGILREPSYGAARVEQGRIHYAPNADFAGSDVLEYGVSDGRNAAKGSLTIDVLIAANRPPLAIDDAAQTPVATPVAIDVLANDSDPDGDTISLLGVYRFPRHGTAAADDAGKIVYQPDGSFESGTDDFAYAISDGGVRSVAGVTVTVTRPGNRAPLAKEDAASTSPGEAVDIAVLANDSDPDGDPVALVGIATPPASGTASIIGGGQVRYVPHPAFVSGADALAYRISDGSSEAVGLVVVTVEAFGSSANRPPLAVADAAATTSNTPVSVSVLANDSDPDGDPLTVTAVGLPGAGSVSLASGVATYVPRIGFAGIDRFMYQVSDGQAVSLAEVVVSISSKANGNRPPVAFEDRVSTEAGTSLLVDVLANDVDPDGDRLRLVGVGIALNGTTALENGSVRYTPNAGYLGTDGFQYQITDGRSAAVGRVEVTVAAEGQGEPNNVPIAVTDAVLTDRGSAVEVDVLANDIDPDGDPLSFVGILREATHAVVAPTDAGLLTYTPRPDFVGVDSLVYGVSDGTNTVFGLVVVTVRAQANRAPVAVDDRTEARSGSDAAIDVLANDIDPDGDALTVVGLTLLPLQGVATIGPTGAVSYRPVAGYSGRDAFAYRTTDGKASADAAIEVSAYVPIAAEQDALPSEVALLPNYPNPFNPATTIAFDLPAARHVRLEVYDLAGRRVTTLVDGERPAGRHLVRFDGSAVASGMYLYRMRSGDFVATRRLVLIK